MGDEKWTCHFPDFEDRLPLSLSRVIKSMEKQRLDYSMLLLLVSSERVNRSMEENSRQANRLSTLISILTWALVGLTVVWYYSRS